MNNVLQLIPHRPPFLFVDEIIAEGVDSLTARRKVRPEEDFFKGHYPGNPIMPGVLICEAVFQTGALLLGRLMAAKGEDLTKSAPVLTRIRDVRFRSIVRPGDELLLEVKITERLGKFMFMTGSARTAGRKVLNVEFGVALVATGQDAPPTTA